MAGSVPVDDNASGMDEERRAAERREDAALVERARSEDADAFGRLYDRWFDRVHDLAFRVGGDATAASDIAQDAFLSAWRKLDGLQDPEAFGGWLLQITRNAALDRRRREERTKPFDSEGLAVIEGSGPSPADAPAGFRVEDRAVAFDSPSRAAEDSELTELVWESAAALGARDAELLDLTLRHGLTPAEVGTVVGLNRNAANQAVHRVRQRLKAAIEARVLWRSGEPACPKLAATLEAAGVTEFGADAVQVTESHASGCEVCQQRRQTKLEPSALFGAAPFVILPLVLKMRVAHALSESGVPMQGSEAIADPTPAEPRRRGHRRARRMLTGGGFVVVVVFLTVGAFADELGEGTIVATLAHQLTPTTTLAPTTTSSLPVEPDTTVTTTAKLKTLTTTPTIPPPPPPTAPPAPPAPTASISVNPSSFSAGYGAGRVVLTWTTANATSVQVKGPGLTTSTAASGTGLPCPPRRTGAGCGESGGVYTYTVTATNSAGVSVSRTATLTIT
jgi:RNA polymerase sigma factor (sigma-70 family)